MSVFPSSWNVSTKSAAVPPQVTEVHEGDGVVRTELPDRRRHVVGHQGEVSLTERDRVARGRVDLAQPPLPVEGASGCALSANAAARTTKALTEALVPLGLIARLNSLRPASNRPTSAVAVTVNVGIAALSVTVLAMAARVGSKGAARVPRRSIGAFSFISGLLSQRLLGAPKTPR
jgi:hypothetical protein